MSNFVFPFPVLPAGNWTWPIKKTPQYTTIQQQSASNRAPQRVTLTPFPIWQFEYDFSYLKGEVNLGATAAQNFIGFFMQVQGAAQDWLFPDPYDNNVANMTFGIGDGANKIFQITRQIGGGVDIIQNLNGAPAIRVNGVLKTSGTDYTIDTVGVVTFASAPAVNAVVAWTGNFYFRCHFIDDNLQSLSQFMYQIWECPSIKWESVIL